MSEDYNSGFCLPQNDRDRVAKLIGENYVDRVESICREYLYYSQDSINKPPRGEVNKKLRELHGLVQQISSILEDKAVRGELDLLIKDQYPNSRDYMLRHGYGFGKFHEDMLLLADATANVQKAKKGRLKGSTDMAARHFVYALYLCCRDTGLPSIRAKLQKLIRIVGRPLGLGQYASFPGLVNEVMQFMKNHPDNL